MLYLYFTTKTKYIKLFVCHVFKVPCLFKSFNFLYQKDLIFFNSFLMLTCVLKIFLYEWGCYKNYIFSKFFMFFYAAFIWLKYCLYGVKHKPINQSICLRKNNRNFWTNKRQNIKSVIYSGLNCYLGLFAEFCHDFVAVIGFLSNGYRDDIQQSW